MIVSQIFIAYHPACLVATGRSASFGFLLMGFKPSNALAKPPRLFSRAHGKFNHEPPRIREFPLWNGQAHCIFMARIGEAAESPTAYRTDHVVLAASDHLRSRFPKRTFRMITPTFGKLPASHRPIRCRDGITNNGRLRSA